MCAVKTWNKCSPCSSFHVSSYIHPARMFRTALLHSAPTSECCADFHRWVHASMLSKSGLTSCQSKPLDWVHGWFHAYFAGAETVDSPPDGSVVVGWLHLAAYVCAEEKAPDANVLLVCITTSLQQWSKKPESSLTSARLVARKAGLGHVDTLQTMRKLRGCGSQLSTWPSCNGIPHSTGLSVGTFQG